MLKIGLTGGIASGKSTVAKFFTALGIDVIDADAISRKLTAPRTLLHKKILNRFPAARIKQNKLDRGILREIISSDPKARIWLEKLLHPLIYKEMFAQLQTVTSPYCILVMPLLLETKIKEFRAIVDRILVVDVLKKDQIKRMMKRDKISSFRAKKIIDMQINRAPRLKAADDVLFNKGSLNELKKEVVRLHKKYLSLVLVKSS